MANRSKTAVEVGRLLSERAVLAATKRVRQRKPRVREPAYLVYIRSLECVNCGNDISVEAAHVRRGSVEWNKPLTGLGVKPDDYWTVPLCSLHHSKQHSLGELLYWFEAKIDAFLIAAKLRHAYPNRELALHHLKWTRTDGRGRYQSYQLPWG